ncbi:MAG: hypothetical protein JRF33_24620 [Deltaproteobacteria bacterium]|nr:hypothetical protein [Deltaproteobacteria bacterium]
MLRSSALIFLLFLQTVPLAAKEPISVAVLEFTSRGSITQIQMDSLNDLVTTEIMKFGDYRVIGHADISSLLDEEAKNQLLGCKDDRCRAEIGGALGVEQLLTGKVSAFGSSFLMKLRLLDVRKVEVIDSLTLRIKGDTGDLLAEVPNSVRELFRKEVILPDRFEVELRFQAGDALLADASASDLWWNENGFDQLNVWGDDWLTLLGDEDSRGIGTGKGWLLGARFGLRVGKLHTVFAQLDYGQEHWRGKVQVGDNDQSRWRLDLDLHVLRLSAGYRFAYPVLDWFWPFVEMAMGLHIPFQQDMETPAGDALGAVGPEPRIILLVNPGLRFQFAERFFVAASWLFDIPLGESTFSGPMLATGAFF